MSLALVRCTTAPWLLQLVLQPFITRLGTGIVKDRKRNSRTVSLISKGKKAKPKLYVLVYRCLHNLASPLLRNIFVLRVDATHTAAVTRGQTTSMLALPTVKSRLGYHSIAYLAAERWNSLPSHCRLCESSAHFIHTIKSLLGYPVIS